MHLTRALHCVACRSNRLCRNTDRIVLCAQLLPCSATLPGPPAAVAVPAGSGGDPPLGLLVSKLLGALAASEKFVVQVRGCCCGGGNSVSLHLKALLGRQALAQKGRVSRPCK